MIQTVGWRMTNLVEEKFNLLSKDWELVGGIGLYIRFFEKPYLIRCRNCATKRTLEYYKKPKELID